MERNAPGDQKGSCLSKCVFGGTIAGTQLQAVPEEINIRARVYGTCPAN